MIRNTRSFTMTPASGSAAWDYIDWYTLYGANNNQEDDIYKMLTLYTQKGSTVTNVAATSERSNRILTQMCNVEIFIAAVTGNTSPVLIDVYRCKCRADIQDSAGKLTAILGSVTASRVNGAAVTTANSAVTLFQIDGFTPNFVILDKQELTMNPGQSACINYRDKRKMFIDGEKVYSRTVAATTPAGKGWTQVYVFCVKNNFSAGSNSVIFSGNKTFTFKSLVDDTKTLSIV